MEVVYQDEGGSVVRTECGCISEKETGLMLYKYNKAKTSNQIGYVPFERLYHVEPSDDEEEAE